jgi:hypothetical protein
MQRKGIYEPLLTNSPIPLPTQTSPRKMHHTEFYVLPQGKCIIPNSMYFPKENASYRILCTSPRKMHQTEFYVLPQGKCIIPNSMYFPKENASYRILCTSPRKMHHTEFYVLPQGKCIKPNSMYFPKENASYRILCTSPRKMHHTEFYVLPQGKCIIPNSMKVADSEVSITYCTTGTGNLFSFCCRVRKFSILFILCTMEPKKWPPVQVFKQTAFMTSFLGVSNGFYWAASVYCHSWFNVCILLECGTSLMCVCREC